MVTSLPSYPPSGTSKFPVAFFVPQENNIVAVRASNIIIAKIFFMTLFSLQKILLYVKKPPGLFNL